MLTYLASCVSSSTVLLGILSSVILLRLQHDMWLSIIRPYVVRFPVNFPNVMQDATRRDNGWNRADVVFHLLSQQTPSHLQPPERILDTHSCPAQPVVKVALVLRCAWSLRVRFHYPRHQGICRIANYGDRDVNVSITLWPVGENNSSCIYRRVRKNSRVMNLARPIRYLWSHTACKMIEYHHLRL